MSGVYGDMLAVFHELMETYEVFKMKPHGGAGYGQRSDERKVRGYWSWRRSGKMDIAGDLRTPNHQATFWMREYYLGKKQRVEQNEYIEVEDQIYVIVLRDDFTHEGGFYKCLMQKLAGVTDRQQTNLNVDRAIRDDY